MSLVPFSVFTNDNNLTFLLLHLIEDRYLRQIHIWLKFSREDFCYFLYYLTNFYKTCLQNILLFIQYLQNQQCWHNHIAQRQIIFEWYFTKVTWTHNYKLHIRNLAATINWTWTQQTCELLMKWLSLLQHDNPSAHAAYKLALELVKFK